jgi:sugar O-acyltransferase (sialic acid O-acetyltransferase NeuD family)
MKQLVVYGVGSAISGDIAETCRRSGIRVAAWIKNVNGPTFQPGGIAAITAEEIGSKLRSLEFIISLFTPRHRWTAYGDARGHGLTRPTVLVDPTAVIASTASLAPGCYVNSLANIAAECRVGEFCFINRGASLGHHADLSEFVSIGPAAVISGNVRIGRGAVISAGAIIVPGQEIGANAFVGAGAVVTRAVPPNCSVMGNPARIAGRDIPAFDDVEID